MNKPKVYIHRAEDWYGFYINENDENKLAQVSELITMGTRMEEMSEDELISKLDGVEIILSLNGKGMQDFTPRVIEAMAKSVKAVYIAHWWHIHNTFVPLCKKAGIEIVEGTNFSTCAVAEWTIGAIIAGIRGIHTADKRMKNGSEWGEPRREFKLVKNSVLGLVGLGRIGRYTANLAKFLGMEIIAFDMMPKEEMDKLGIKKVELDELFSTADVISLHLPVFESTTGIVGKKQFELMKDGAVFVNSARAALLDENALIQALKTKNITAYLDVFAAEPLDLNSPLRTLENAVINPHMAGDNFEMFNYCGSDTVDNIISYIKTGAIDNRQYTL